MKKTRTVICIFCSAMIYWSGLSVPISSQDLSNIYPSAQASREDSADKTLPSVTDVAPAQSATDPSPSSSGAGTSLPADAETTHPAGNTNTPLPSGSETSPSSPDSDTATSSPSSDTASSSPSSDTESSSPGPGAAPSSGSDTRPSSPADSNTVLPSDAGKDSIQAVVEEDIDPEEVESKIDYVDCLRRLGLMDDQSKDKALNLRNAVIRFQSCCNMAIDAKWSNKCMNALKKIVNSDVFNYTDIVPEPPTPSKWLTVNKTRRILTLYAGSEVLEKYPVAVGNPSSLTPSGKYQIVSRVINPVWGGGGYAKPIKGGTPENPLGYRWMGLSYKDGTRLGIHGNNSPYSIGKYISHGCIRMINTDVESLFEKVTVKTPVWIGSEKELKAWGISQEEYK